MKSNKSKLISVGLIALLAFGLILTGACTAPKIPAAPSEAQAPETAEVPEAVKIEEANDPAEDAGYRVLVINDGSTDPSFDITKAVVKTVDESKVGDEKTIEFAGRQYNAKYEETYEYVIGNFTLDAYSVIDENTEGLNKHVMLLPDGDVHSLLGVSAASLDIDKNASPEDVRIAVEEALKEEIDFGRFEFHNAESDFGKDDPEDSGNYMISWFNKKGEIKTADSLSVTVDRNGEVNTLKMRYKNNYGIETVPEDLRIDNYIPAIESKLRDIYGEALNDYELYPEMAKVTNIGGKPCVYFTMGVDYSEGDEPISELIRLAVLLEP